jgi:hypothetical protein
MHEAARALLERLLAAAERRGPAPGGAADRGLSVVLPLTVRRAPEYVARGGLADREAIHAALENAAAAGAVSLEWGRFEEARDLKRLRLVDADRLAAFLGAERVGVRLERLRAALAPVRDESAPWLRAVLDDATERWGRGGRAHGLGVDEVPEVVALFQALAAVDRGEHRGLDLRTFSARALGDSKAMERLQSRVAAVFREHLDLADLDDAELYLELGLEKYPQPLFLRGPLRLAYGGTIVDLAGLRPYAAFSPDAVAGVEPVGAVDYVLTVENLTSFQRHVRTLVDRGVVLYSAGFPGPSFRGFLRWLDAALAEATPFFHWGDVDVGGLRIFARLAAVLSRHTLRPHLMGPPGGGEPGRPFSAEELRRLRRMAQGEDPGASLARAWLTAGAGAREQEALEPASPLG